MAKAIPKWEMLQRHFPALNASRCALLIGGKVKYNHDIGVFTNFCCIRVSHALNKSGHPVKYFKDISSDRKTLKPAVTSGKDGRWNVFRVRSLRKYMERHYGRGEQIPLVSYKKSLKGRYGIIVYVVPGWNDASGHADCWADNDCLWKDYGNKASSILFWEAP